MYSKNQGELVDFFFPSRLFDLFIRNQADREQSLGWGFTQQPVGKDSARCLPVLLQPTMTLFPSDSFTVGLLTSERCSAASHGRPWVWPPCANQGVMWDDEQNVALAFLCYLIYSGFVRTRETSVCKSSQMLAQASTDNSFNNNKPEWTQAKQNWSNDFKLFT